MRLSISKMSLVRHSCASYMLKMGCSMKEIADWLGHSNITTAMNVYAHLDFEAKKNVANRFRSILSFQMCDVKCDAKQENLT